MERTLSGRALLIFVIIAFGGAWLVALPLWLGRGITSPALRMIAVTMMFTPSLALLITWLGYPHLRRLGLRGLGELTGLGWGDSVWRTVVATLALWLGLPVVVVLATVISGTFGFVRLDLNWLAPLGGSAAALAPGEVTPTVIALSLGAIALTPLVNAIPTFGEEWGWRGWLLPQLRRWGTARAIVISGLIWGLWHAPLTLLGYNYASLGPAAALMFLPFCVAFGAVLGWTRLATGSVWPAVAGHGVFNGSTVLVRLLGADERRTDFVWVGPISVFGIALFALIAIVLFAVSRSPKPRRRLDEPSGVPALG